MYNERSGLDQLHEVLILFGSVREIHGMVWNGNLYVVIGNGGTVPDHV